jgi:hypothetical protein
MNKNTEKDIELFNGLLEDVNTLMNEMKALPEKMKSEAGKEMVAEMLEGFIPTIKELKAGILVELDDN